jgi:hypothetical protein
VGENVDAHHVGEAEGAGARPAERLAGERIHLFDGQALLQHQRGCREHDRDADAVGDEVGGVVGKDDLLAEVAVGEGGKGGHDGGIGFGGGDDFEQAHVARRIEEMRSEEAVAMPGESGGDLLDRQAGGVGGEQGLGGQMRHNAASSAVLMARFSATASMTQSQAASLGRSSSKLPGVMSAASEDS